jgi:hypothetical protein
VSGSGTVTGITDIYLNSDGDSALSSAATLAINSGGTGYIKTNLGYSAQGSTRAEITGAQSGSLLIDSSDTNDDVYVTVGGNPSSATSTGGFGAGFNPAGAGVTGAFGSGSGSIVTNADIKFVGEDDVIVSGQADTAFSSGASGQAYAGTPFGKTRGSGGGGANATSSLAGFAPLDDSADIKLVNNASANTTFVGVGTAAFGGEPVRTSTGGPVFASGAASGSGTVTGDTGLSLYTVVDDELDDPFTQSGSTAINSVAGGDASVTTVEGGASGSGGSALNGNILFSATLEDDEVEFIGASSIGASGTGGFVSGFSPPGTAAPQAAGPAILLTTGTQPVTGAISASSGSADSGVSLAFDNFETGSFTATIGTSTNVVSNGSGVGSNGEGFGASTVSGDLDASNLASFQADDDGDDTVVNGTSTVSFSNDGAALFGAPVATVFP